MLVVPTGTSAQTLGQEAKVHDQGGYHRFRYLSRPSPEFVDSLGKNGYPSGIWTQATKPAF